MRKGWNNASFTIEASIVVPILIFTIMTALRIGIDFFQESAVRQINEELEKLNIVTEFYNYQIIGEVKEEMLHD